MQLLKETIGNEKGDLEFLVSLDLSQQEMPEHLRDFDMTITKDVNISLKIILMDPAYPSDTTRYFSSLFQLILQTASLDVRIYHGEGYRNGYYLICKNRYVCYYLQDRQGRIQAMHFTDDAQMVQLATKKTADLFTNRRLLQEAIDEHDFEYMIFKGFQHSALPVLVAAPYLNGFFLTPEILRSFGARNSITPQEQEELLLIQEQSDRILSSNDVRYLLPEQTLCDFVRNGEIQTGLHRIFLTRPERKDYLLRMVQVMEQSERFHLHLVGRDQLPFTRMNTQYSLRIFPPRTYLKKDLAFVKPGSPVYYNISSHSMAQSLTDLLTGSILPEERAWPRARIVQYLRDAAENI